MIEQCSVAQDKSDNGMFVFSFPFSLFLSLPLCLSPSLPPSLNGDCDACVLFFFILCVLITLLQVCLSTIYFGYFWKPSDYNFVG